MRIRANPDPDTQHCPLYNLFSYSLYCQSINVKKWKKCDCLGHQMANQSSEDSGSKVNYTYIPTGAVGGGRERGVTLRNPEKYLDHSHHTVQSVWRIRLRDFVNAGPKPT